MTIEDNWVEDISTAKMGTAGKGVYRPWAEKQCRSRCETIHGVQGGSG